MQDTVRRTVGSIVIAWNRAEDAIAAMAALYLDIDALTYDLLVKTLRPQDREELLKAVVNAKEFDEQIQSEIKEAVGRAKICRQNRNTILHRIGDLDGNLTAASEVLLENVLASISAQCTYLNHLHDQLVAILFDRASRDVPNAEGQSGDDELRPVVEFTPPDRPARPKQLKFESLEVEE